LYAQSQTPVVVYSTSGLDTGWHHFAIAWDETVTSLYIDGEHIGDGGGITSTHNRLKLSSLFDGLTGYIDELASYGYMKTGPQITEDFEAKSSPHENVAPTVEAGADQTVNQGDTVSLIGSFTDPDSDSYTIHWDFGDGDTADGDLEVDHSYANPDTYTVNLTVTDDDGGVGSDTLQVTVVTVSNVAPTVEAGDNQTVNQGDTVSLIGSFTDPDSDSYTIHWDFGDGDTADGDLEVDHSYANPDTYTVNLTVTDDDGGIGSDTLQVTVIEITHDARAMLEFQIEKAKIEVSKVSVKGTLELDPSGDGADISEEVVVIMGPFSETIPGGTMVVDKKGKWEYKRPTGVEGIIQKMKIDWNKGKFEFTLDKADLSELTDPDNVTISIQIGDDFGQKTITMVITYEYSMPR
jgi:PKD repeat protein